jgi:hypothetical protein
VTNRLPTALEARANRLRAKIDSNGFGGHTALFNCMVTYKRGDGHRGAGSLTLCP